MLYLFLIFLFSCSSQAVKPTDLSETLFYKDVKETTTETDSLLKTLSKNFPTPEQETQAIIDLIVKDYNYTGFLEPSEKVTRLAKRLEKLNQGNLILKNLNEERIYGGARYILMQVLTSLNFLDVEYSLRLYEQTKSIFESRRGNAFRKLRNYYTYPLLNKMLNEYAAMDTFSKGLSMQLFSEGGYLPAYPIIRSALLDSTYYFWYALNAIQLFKIEDDSVTAVVANIVRNVENQDRKSTTYALRVLGLQASEKGLETFRWFWEKYFKNGYETRNDSVSILFSSLNTFLGERGRDSSIPLALEMCERYVNPEFGNTNNKELDSKLFWAERNYSEDLEAKTIYDSLSRSSENFSYFGKTLGNIGTDSAQKVLERELNTLAKLNEYKSLSWFLERQEEIQFRVHFLTRDGIYENIVPNYSNETHNQQELLRIKKLPENRHRAYELNSGVNRLLFKFIDADLRQRNLREQRGLKNKR